MPTAGIGSDMVRLSVANLQLVLDARGTGIRMSVPAAHARFLAGAADDCLALSVRHGSLRQTETWRPLYVPLHTWQLWQDERERYVFVTEQRSRPARQVAVDAGFRFGEVLGQFGNHAGSAQPIYPLRGLGAMLFANWLAQSGDLILHAAAMEVGGCGYAFAGRPGAGKSTLAAALMEVPGSAVLGEDNAILRYLEGRFWIFGTPWHLNPAMCSPRGAPLEKLFFLDRSAKDSVSPCAPSDGVARLLQTAFVPYYRPAAVAAILDRLALLAEQVPFYTLHYRLGSDPLPAILGT